jgi:hypothetical protein
LHELIEKNDIGLTIRFAIKADQPNGKKTRAMQHILQHLVGNIQKDHIAYKRLLLHDWFKWMDYERFSKAYPADNIIDVTKTLLLHSNWTEEAKIQATPTVFINGFKMPKPYLINDLPGLIKELITNAKEIQKDKEKTAYLFL